MNDTLSVEGFAELTAANRGTFKLKICAALNRQTSLEIDLSRTTSMDCAGLGALIALGKITRERNGAMRLVNPTAAVSKLFDLVQAGKYLEIIHTIPTPATGLGQAVFSISNPPEPAPLPAVPA